MRRIVCSGHDVTSFFEAVDDSITSGFAPTLAITFCSVALNLGELQRGLAQRGVAVVGASSAGEIADNSVLHEACVALMTDANPISFRVFQSSVATGQTMFDAGLQLGRFAIETFDNPIVLVFIAGARVNGEPVVPGVREGAGHPIPLFGGMAGDDLVMKDTYVFSSEAISNEGIIGLVLDGRRFQVNGITANGWQPVGVAKTITRSDGNTVYTIDGNPALEVYKRYLQIDFEQPRMSAGVHYPLRVLRENGTSVLRPPLYYGDDQSVIFAGSVPEGSKVTFCIPPSFDIVERVLAEADALRLRMPQADALVLIECVARYLALDFLAKEEIQGMHDMWPAPMVGFFSYGEIGASDPRHCDFHTESFTLVALREINE